MAKKEPKEQIPLFLGLDLKDIHPVETVSDDVAEKYVFETVDFSNPERSKTCLEIDFPILKVNEVAALEVDPPCKKPIYMMSKWWARRSSAVFRALCTAAALKAPSDESKVSQLIWAQMYKKSIRKKKVFDGLKLLDIFMGGGTTVVEAARLGFDVTGVELNPVAWWIVRNEVVTVDHLRVEEFGNYIRKIVEPQIKPYFSLSSPWNFPPESESSSKKTKINEANGVNQNGPETVYTFWIKHIMCEDPSCCHLTPQIDTSIVAEKKSSVDYIDNCVCPKCGSAFDLELDWFRMSPNANFIKNNAQAPWTSVDILGNAKCPDCSAELDKKWILQLCEKRGKPKKKNVINFLLLPKEWLKGITAPTKSYYGGYFGSEESADEKWFLERSKNLYLIEVRGEVPIELSYSNFSQKVVSEDTDSVSGSTGNIICSKCGRVQNPLDSIKITGKLAPIFPYLVQGFDPIAKIKKIPYGGRFFALPDYEQILNCFRAFKDRKDLAEYIPNESLFYGFKTHFWGIPDHGYTHWYKMFNPRQLFVHALLAKTITEAPESIADNNLKSQMLGAFQNYLRQNCAFSFWSIHGDQLKGHFSNNNYHPKAIIVENSVFSEVGSGNFNSCIGMVVEGMKFAKSPYERRLSQPNEKGKSQKVSSDDWLDSSKVKLFCQSSTDLKRIVPDSTIDLVITDPPFGDNVQYAELADFFSVWLKRPLQQLFPEIFINGESPKSLEAVTNKARHPGKTPDGLNKSDLMYDRLLGMCWKEAYRTLKPGGILAFTFHHDKDIAWIAVLESLFEAGFQIEATFPIRSDVMKGDGNFGSQKIEYDIVHVCRKRLSEPKEIYWATLRRKIIDGVNDRAGLMAQHRASGLHLADLEIIIRGEVLEQFSKHFGKVKKNLAGDSMSVREILIEAGSVAIALLQQNGLEKIPENVDPETRVLFNLFREGPEIEFNAARKRLKGSGCSLEEMKEYGWISILRKGSVRFAVLNNIQERWASLSRKKTLNSDYDQVHFAINCCIGGKIFKEKSADWESWILENYKILLPSVGPILRFIDSNHFGSDVKVAAGVAYRILERTLTKIKESNQEFRKSTEQLSFFE